MARDYVLQPFRPPVDLQIDYAAELNEQQQAAVTALPGPALVIAGAGSGKTRTLTYRVAYLIEQGIPPDRILLLTFTNKAAREMMRRVADLLGAELQSLWGGTFHSIGARLLRRHAAKLGFRPDFTIMDREDAVDLLKACLGEAQLDLKGTLFPKPEVLAELFSMAANTRCEIPELIAGRYAHFTTWTSRLDELAKRYAARKKAANLMDFDDLLLLWVRLLTEDEEIRQRYQSRFQFVLVDEYQDTNRLQSDLIDLLVEKHHNLMVVGDDSQSIYSWRGANFQNILDFPDRYPEAKVYKIETNYRSTPEILSVANAAIAPNQQQFSKTLVAVRKSGPKPALVVCHEGKDQAAFVAQRMLELHEEGVNLNSIAVLYRSHFHALEVQLELTRHHIPFFITSGIRFFEQAHIKDMAAYLKLVANPTDELAFMRLVLMLPGVGAKAAQKLWAAFRAPPPAAASAGSAPLASALQRCQSAVPKKALTAWTEFVVLISQIEDPAVRARPSQMIRMILEASYDEYLQANFTKYESRVDDVEQLETFAGQMGNLQECLTQLSLLTNVEADDRETTSGDSERVRLSTVHQAKGLEFDVVFLIMLGEGLFPSARSLETPEGEEEERRLFYVAITRARNELYLSYPLLRLARSYGSDTILRPSRFLRGLSQDLVEEWNLKSSLPYDGTFHS